MSSQIEYYENKLKYEMDVWDLYRALSGDEEVIVVDTRPVDMYVTEHIPSAINLPHLTINEVTTRALSKTALYVTYCEGVGCNAGTEGALKLARLGFRVKELMGGLDWWIRVRYATDGSNAHAGQEIG